MGSPDNMGLYPPVGTSRTELLSEDSGTIIRPGWGTLVPAVPGLQIQKLLATGSGPQKRIWVLGHLLQTGDGQKIEHTELTPSRLFSLATSLLMMGFRASLGLAKTGSQIR